MPQRVFLYSVNKTLYLFFKQWEIIISVLFILSAAIEITKEKKQYGA